MLFQIKNPLSPKTVTLIPTKMVTAQDNVVGADYVLWRIWKHDIFCLASVLFVFYFYAACVNTNVFFGWFILGTAESFPKLLTDVSFLQCEQSLLLVQY